MAQGTIESLHELVTLYVTVLPILVPRDTWVVPEIPGHYT